MGVAAQTSKSEPFSFLTTERRGLTVPMRRLPSGKTQMEYREGCFLRMPRRLCFAFDRLLSSSRASCHCHKNKSPNPFRHIATFLLCSRHTRDTSAPIPTTISVDSNNTNNNHDEYYAQDAFPSLINGDYSACCSSSRCCSL